jgi:16S rRNA G966 N2-methylase RsmD
MTYQGDVFKLLPLIEKKGEFDIIFADPPYFEMRKDKLFSAQLLLDVASLNLLKSGATLFIEEGGEISFPPTRLTPLPVRRYGRTYLYTFKA